MPDTVVLTVRQGRQSRFGASDRIPPSSGALADLMWQLLSPAGFFMGRAVTIDASLESEQREAVQTQNTRDELQ